jgi:hypothetical protein
LPVEFGESNKTHTASWFSKPVSQRTCCAGPALVVAGIALATLGVNWQIILLGFWRIISRSLANCFALSGFCQNLDH